VGMTRFWNNNNLDILFCGHDTFKKRVMPPKQDIYVFIIPETRHANETGYLRFYYSRNVSCPRNRIFTFLLFQKLGMPTKQDIYVFIIPESRHAHRGHDAFLE
jgi:hypothetical protein